MTVHREPEALARLLDALAEPTRRRSYEAVRSARTPLSRVQVAHLLGIRTRLAAFHLDRLVADGLLVAHYARPVGRPGGPGAGRPTKWYSTTGDALDVSLPPRRNDLAALILLRALGAEGDPRADAVVLAARRTGEELAAECETDADLHLLLTDLGYEPTQTLEGGLDLVNCPFHELATHDRATICSMSHAMLDAASARAHSARVTTLDPREGRCCVRLTPALGTAPDGT